MQNQLYFWQSNYAVRIDGPTEAQDQIAQSLSRRHSGSIAKSLRSPRICRPTTLSKEPEKYLLNPEAIDRCSRTRCAKLGI